MVINDSHDYLTPNASFLNQIILANQRGERKHERKQMTCVASWIKDVPWINDTELNNSDPHTGIH